MDLPEPLKLAALAEASKRSQAARIAAATGSAPWTVTHSAAESPATLAVPEPIAPASSSSVSIDERAWDQIFKDWRPTPEKMMLAFDEHNEPIYVALNELLSGVIIGRQKQGKTTLLRLIYAQCLMIGVDVRVWDLHEDIVDDLPGASASTTAATIKRSAAEVTAELERRIRLRLKNGVARPIMVLADEVNNLVGAVPEVVPIFERLIAEGRKYDMYCDVSAKGIPADLFKQSWVRDSVNTRVAFLTTPHQARLIGIDNDAARLVSNLTPGHALLDGPVQAQLVTFPNVTADNVRALVSPGGAAKAASSGAFEPLRATSATSGEVDWVVSRSGGEAASEAGSKAAAEAGDPFEDPPGEDDPVRQRVLDMLRAGKSQNAIIRDVYGVKGGDKYTQAAAEIRQIVKESLA
jgi:hypothetical protein